MVDELLLVSGSDSDALTTVVLFNCPVACGITTMFTVAEAVFVRFPRLQVTVVVPMHIPCVGVTGPRVTPAGNVSVTITFVAGDGPLFVTKSLYVRLAPTIAGLGDAVFTIERFALVVPDTINETDVECRRFPLVAVMFRT